MSSLLRTFFARSHKNLELNEEKLTMDSLSSQKSKSYWRLPPERKDKIEIRVTSSKLLNCLPFTSFERWEHLKCLPVQDLSVVDVDQVNSYHQEYYNRKVHDGTLDNLLELFRRTHKYCLQMLLSPKYQLALFNLTKKMMTERKSMDHTTSALYRWNLTDIFS